MDSVKNKASHLKNLLSFIARNMRKGKPVCPEGKRSRVPKYHPGK